MEDNSSYLISPTFIDVVNGKRIGVIVSQD